MVARGSPRAVDTVALIYGLGTRIGVELPFSRSQESEADRIGLILMAKAGYDPHKALEVWRRMERSGFQLEFLSTHPSHDTRLKDIEVWLPEASAHYRTIGEPEKTVEIARAMPHTTPGGSESIGTRDRGSVRVAPSIEKTEAQSVYRDDVAGREKLAYAEVYREQQLAFTERTHGADHPAVADALSDLAEVYHAQKKYYDAEALYKRAVAIKQSTYGFEHSEVAAVLSKLAALYLNQGETERAEKLYKQSLAITEKTFGADDPRAVNIRNVLSSLDRELKNLEK